MLNEEDKKILISILYQINLSVKEAERVLEIINKLKGGKSIEIAPPNSVK